MRRFLAAVLCQAFLAFPAHATTFATDATDLWWVGDTEDGWGANVVQQNEILFITFFVYGPSGTPTWYAGTSTAYVGAINGALVYNGPLYQTGGPWFGGPWNQSLRTTRQVGAVTFSMDSITTATLGYSVDGVSVTKHVKRQTWRVNDLAGNYLGAMIGTYVNCGSSNGYAENPGVIAVTHASTTVTLVASLAGGTCTFSGPYNQDGRMGSFDGPFTCTNGISGTFHAFEIEANFSALAGRASAQFNGSTCLWGGRFGGVRKDP